ncbi:MAG: TolC family protein [Acidobacteria bacterium]|nr:TolC family protein [Acidobacteriota bacterium]MDW7985044.1 TolC family protein [Acidobacteriota bacterium]
MIRRAFVIIAFLTSLTLGSEATSQTTPSPADLLTSLVEELRAQNPILRQLRYEMAAAQQRIDPAGTLPNPTVTVGGMSVRRPVPGAELGREEMAQQGISLVQGLPFPGKLRLSQEVARQEVAVRAARLRAVEVELIRQLKDRYYELAFLERWREVLLQSQRVLQVLQAGAQALYVTGQESQQSVLRVQSELTRLQSELLDLERMRGEVIAQFNALLGRNPGRPWMVPVELPPPVTGRAVALEDDPELLPPETTLYEWAQARNPALQEVRAMLERDDRMVARMRRDLYPDLVLMAGYFNRGGLPPLYEIRIGLELPVFFRRKEMPRIEEALQMKAADEALLQARWLDVSQQIRETYLQARTAAQVWRLYQSTLLPQLRTTLDSGLATYRVGKLAFVQVLETWQALLAAEVETARQLKAFHQARVRLEALVGSWADGPIGR